MINGEQPTPQQQQRPNEYLKETRSGILNRSVQPQPLAKGPQAKRVPAGAGPARGSRPPDALSPAAGEGQSGPSQPRQGMNVKGAPIGPTQSPSNSMNVNPNFNHGAFGAAPEEFDFGPDLDFTKLTSECFPGNMEQTLNIRPATTAKPAGTPQPATTDTSAQTAASKPSSQSSDNSGSQAQAPLTGPDSPLHQLETSWCTPLLARQPQFNPNFPKDRPARGAVSSGASNPGVFTGRSRSHNDPPTSQRGDPLPPGIWSSLTNTQGNVAAVPLTKLPAVNTSILGTRAPEKDDSTRPRKRRIKEKVIKAADLSLPMSPPPRAAIVARRDPRSISHSSRAVHKQPVSFSFPSTPPPPAQPDPPKPSPSPASTPAAPTYTAAVPTAHPSTAPETLRISSLMSVSEITDHLANHGCKNITGRLDMTLCSIYPIFTGGFGDVYRGNLDDGTSVAIKTMRLQIESDQKSLKHAARELYTWSKCRHPNVVELLGVVEFKGQIGMVSRWMGNGCLPSYLNRHPDVDRCRMCLQISEGLAYLHRNNIVHGDLKGLNVLISNEGIPALTDFGNAILRECSLQFTATAAKHNMSARWAVGELILTVDVGADSCIVQAPEIIEETGAQSFAADVYALGMTILETITGQVPYVEKTADIPVYFAVVSGKHPKRPEDHISANSHYGNILWSMLTRCWAYEAGTRPGVDDVVEIMKTITRERLMDVSGGVD